LKALPQVTNVQLWELPFQTLRDQLTLENTSRNPARSREVFAFEPFAVRPVLWKARTRHFQGRREIVDDENAKGSDETIGDHREAAQLYTDKSVRPTDRAIAQTPSGERRVNSSAKLDATYWVGLLLFDDGKFDVAAPWLERPELQAAESRWKSGASYNLARTYEAQGKIDQAVALLEAGTSPQRHGNLLRARRLKSQPEKTSE
jgi:tetratricopeptide (TPR) repeat protein